jgi:hypothetical protein
MALPKLKIPMFDATIPSTKKNIKYRPFLVKEEKILLMAQSGANKTEMINALKQVINNCSTNLDGSDVDVDELTTFDLEYMFVKIRSKSVDNIVKLKYIDHQDEKTYEFEVKLDELEVKFDKEHTNKIKVSDDIGIVMKYPTAALMGSLDLEAMNETEITTTLIKECMEKIYDEDTVYVVKENDPKELEEFIDSLNVKAFEEIQKFFATMPKLYHKIEYTNSKGTAREIELSSLDDFFTFA